MATTPILAPSGDVHMATPDQLDGAIKAGGKPVYIMRDPKGVPRWATREQVPQALNAKGDFFTQAEHHRFDPSVPAFEARASSSTGARGTWKAVQGVVTEGLVGHKLHQWFPETTEAMGIAPIENPLAAGQGEHRNQLLVPESLMESDPRHAKAEPMSKGERFTRGILSAGGGLTTPGNIAMMAIPIGGFAGLFGKGAEAIVPRLVSAGFSSQMLYSLYKQWPQFKDAMDRGDYGAASEMAGQGAVTLAAAFMATKHAVFGEGGAPVPRDKVAKVLKQAEKDAQMKGFVGMRRPEGPQLKVDTEIRPGAVEEYRAQQEARRKAEGGKPEQATMTGPVKEAQRKAQEARVEAARAADEAHRAEAQAAGLAARREAAQKARLERRRAKAAARPSISEPPRPEAPGQTAFGAALRQALGAPVQPRQPRPAHEPGIEAVGEQVGRAAETSGLPTPETLVQGFAESRMMSRDELARDIRSRHKSRVSDDERWWLYQHMRLNGEPLPAKAPPVPKTEFGQKLQKAIAQPVRPTPETPEPPTPPRVAAVAQGVQQAAETSRPPTLERQVWEFAQQRNMDPASLAEDIQGKHPTRRTPEEKAWLANYKRWAGTTGLEEPPAPTPTPTARGPAPKPAPAETKPATPETKAPVVETKPKTGFVESALRGATRKIKIGGIPDEVADPIAEDILRVGSEKIAALESNLRQRGITSLKPIGAGMGSIALETNDGRVVRLGRGVDQPRPNIPQMLQTEHQGTIHDVRYEITPKVKTEGITDADVDAMSRVLEAQGYEFADAGTDNLGRTPDGKLVVIDPGAIKKAEPKAEPPAEEPPPEEPERITEGDKKKYAWHNQKQEGGVSDDWVRKIQAVAAGIRARNPNMGEAQVLAQAETTVGIETKGKIGDEFAPTKDPKLKAAQKVFLAAFKRATHSERKEGNRTPAEDLDEQMRTDFLIGAFTRPEADVLAKVVGHQNDPENYGYDGAWHAWGHMRRALENAGTKETPVKEAGEEGDREEPEQPKAEPTTPPQAPAIEPPVPSGTPEPAQAAVDTFVNSVEDIVAQGKSHQKTLPWEEGDDPTDTMEQATAAFEKKGWKWNDDTERLERKGWNLWIREGREGFPPEAHWSKSNVPQWKAQPKKIAAPPKPTRELTEEQKARIAAQIKQSHPGVGASPEEPEPTAEPQAAAAEPTPKKEPPIAKFRQQAAAIEAKLPPVKEGFTRLWRGNRPGEEGNPSYTSDLPGIALPFREGYGGSLTWVDVPTADLPKYQAGAGATDAEYQLPPEVAKKIGGTINPKAGPAKIEPPPTPTGEPAPAQAAAAAPENELEAARREYDELLKKKKDLTADEIKRMNELQGRIQDLDETKAVPLVTVQSDPRDKNKTHLDYYLKALDAVKQAWVRHAKRTNPDVKHSDKDWWDVLTQFGRGPKPPEFPGNYIRVEVPGDGKFKIVNNPKNLAEIMKGAPTAFRRPGKTPEPSGSVPRAPKEFNVDAYLAQLDAEREDLKEQLKFAEGDRAEQLEEELRANEENRRVALHGEEAPEAAPAAKPLAPERTFTPPKPTPVTPARDKNEAHADYNAAVADYRTATPKDAQRDYDATLTGVAAALDKSGLEPDPEHVLKGNTSARSPWYWELNSLWHNPLASENPNQSLATIVKKLEATLPTVARKVETDRKDWLFTSSTTSVEKMRGALEDGDYGKELAQATKFAAEQRRKAQILEALGGETPKTRAARKAADETDLQVAQKRHWAEVQIADREKVEAAKAEEKARQPFTRAERMRPLASLKVKPREAWTPEPGKVYRMDDAGKVISDGRVVVRMDKPTIEGKKAQKWRDTFESVVPDKKTVVPFEEMLPKEPQPLTFLGYQNEGGDVGDLGYFLKPDGTMIGVNPHRMGLFRELYGDDVTYTGDSPDKPIAVLKDGDPVGLISPIKITEGHIDLDTARKALAVRGGIQKDVGGGGRGRARPEREGLEEPPRPPNPDQTALFDRPAAETAWDAAAVQPYRNFPSPPARGGGGTRQRSAAPRTTPTEYTTEELGELVGPLPPRPGKLRAGFDETMNLAKRSLEQTKHLFVPELVDRDSQIQANLRKVSLGQIANKTALDHRILKQSAKVLNKLSPEAKLGWVYAAETGAKVSDNPALNDLAQTWWNIQKPLWNEVRKRSGIQTVHENFMAHGLWENPQQAENWYAGLGLRTLEGRKGFAKQRSLPTIKDGIARGLKPVTTDPVEMMMLKIHEMEKFIAGHDEFEKMKTLGIAQYAPGGMKNRIPDDYVEAPNPWGKVYAKKAITFREAVDTVLFKNLNDFAASLGIKHYREKPMTDGTLGYADPMSNEVVTKIATPINTLVHEIGHLIDLRFGPEGKTLNQVMTRKGKMAKELRALADLRFEGQTNVSQYYKDYVRKGTEKIANLVDAFITQPDRLREVAPESDKFFREFLAGDPRLKPLLDIRPSLTRSAIDHPIGKPEFEHMGTWYIPKSSARVIENSLSPGISNAPIIQLFRKGSNAMVQARLGLSLRHGLFTAFEPSVSLFGKGVRQIARGQYGEAAKNILRSNPLWMPMEAIKAARRGNAAIDQFFGKGLEGAENSKIFQDVTSAGGRVAMDRWYQNNAVDEFAKRWREGERLMPIRGLNAAIETFAYPIMQWWVPRLKMAVFMDNYQTELDAHPYAPIDTFDFGHRYFESLKPEDHAHASEIVKALHYGTDLPEPPEGMNPFKAERMEQRVAHVYELARQMKKQEVMQKVWDSVDNRLGQLVYDNLFWNRTMKEVGQMGLQSLGWNLGSWKEVGGGAADMWRAGKYAGLSGVERLRGRPQAAAASMAKAQENLTMKATYALAYAPVVGMMGLMAQYIMTGKFPQTAKDWWYDAFFPHNGKGDERVSLPGYHLDAYKLTQGYAYGPGEGIKATSAEIAAKVNPLDSTFAAMINNRDFYGTQVYDPEDPRWKEAISLGEYALRSFFPYSYTNLGKLAGPAGGRVTPGTVAQSVLGITRAPSTLAETPAMHLLGGYAQENRRAGAMSKEQYAHAQLRRQLAEELKSGDPKAVEEEFTKLHEGKITAKDLPTIRSMSREPWMVHVMESSYVTLPQALHAYEIATPEEKKLLRPGLLKKGSQLPPDRTSPLWDRWRKALEDTSYQAPFATPMTSLQPLPAP